MRRRDFMVGAGCLAILSPVPALGAVASPGAAAAGTVWAELDVLVGKPLAQRGRGALDVATFVDGLSVEQQAHPRVQSGVRLAMSWLGEALLEVRDTMAAIAGGAEVDEAALAEGLGGSFGHSRRERRALASAQRGMRPDNRKAYARRVASDIDRLHKEAIEVAEHGIERSNLLRTEPSWTARARQAHPGASSSDEITPLMILGLLAAGFAGLVGMYMVVFGGLALIFSVLSGGAELGFVLFYLVIGALLLWLSVWAIQRILRTIRGKRSRTSLRFITPELIAQE